jgi:hypothetical protein
VRGELLPFWDAGEDPDAATVEAWQTGCWRVALGVELVAHLEPVLAIERCRVGFCCESAELAEEFVRLIAHENLQARTEKAHPDALNQREACDVLLPLRPNAPEDEVDNAIVAAVKASHTILCPANLRPRPDPAG